MFPNFAESEKRFVCKSETYAVIPVNMSIMVKYVKR